MSSIQRISGHRAKLDLNLIVSLDALLRERSVSRAAIEVGLSQPAMSAALARLRRYFGDPLLARVGNSYQLTPLARSLVERTTVAISAVDRVLDAEPGIEIERSSREFTLIMSDYMLAAVGDTITRDLLAQAPHLRINFVQLRPEIVDRASDSLRTADALVVPRGFVSDLPSVDLFSDRWVCVVAEDNEHVGDAIRLDQLTEYPWAVFQTHPHAATTPLHQVRAQGVEPYVQVVGENYLALPYFVAHTDRIALLPERLAARMSGGMGIRSVDFPLNLAPLNHALWWHPMYNADPEHRWLRTQLVKSLE
ncbi:MULTISPECIES: LysR family transcriptional regulator [Rhodococcus]|uniref:LysR family transcriptional regulator n=1 Tax=Rhodococcus opacus RKJ300 = JCM 13270 TaxID=1165867 RepID=I0WAM1_RHOOP|nr:MULTISPECIES: LysR family transcriptional regulator [Rhodococcus]EID73437.1 LysR family transcriptional regulator [Rhodococcus opacus RKJ300 = JCM 13270]QQZ13000.1 LysR family transcriptional regulator [Rhodococcus sp. 21391]